MMDLDSPPFLIAGHSARPTSVSQMPQAHEQEDLPEAAEVDVFPALVAEPEVLRQA